MPTGTEALAEDQDETWNGDDDTAAAADDDAATPEDGTGLET
jgi:hypothetical protein